PTASTHGAFGALAVGIGTSEVEHVLATHGLVWSEPRTMEARLTGAAGPGVTAKDLILALMGSIGTAGATGHVIEYTGDAIRALSMEERMTVCNMSIEAGARAGMIAPDETTFAYLVGRPAAPTGAAWPRAVDAGAQVVRGRRVASGVEAMVVPGSQLVRAQAEREGLDRVFREAGFEWRNAGCSMCLGMNPDILQPGERCASTSNRNFEGRQGRGGRTHLMSPPMAAAAAVEGRLVDVREWELAS